MFDPVTDPSHVAATCCQTLSLMPVVETRDGDPGNFKVSYVAVDDGRRAWPVSAVIGLGGIQPGDHVRLRVAGPSVKIISRTSAAGLPPGDAGPENGPFAGQ